MFFRYTLFLIKHPKVNSKMKYLLSSFAINGALCCLFGAFGAHALKAYLTEHWFQVYQTGVQYHFYHTFALAITCVLYLRSPIQWFYRAMLGFNIGIVLFSGSLYCLSMTAFKILGMITPIGGVVLILSWLILGLGVYQTCSISGLND